MPALGRGAARHAATGPLLAFGPLPAAPIADPDEQPCPGRRCRARSSASKAGTQLNYHYKPWWPPLAPSLRGSARVPCAGKSRHAVAHLGSSNVVILRLLARFTLGVGIQHSHRELHFVLAAQNHRGEVSGVGCGERRAGDLKQRCSSTQLPCYALAWPRPSCRLFKLRWDADGRSSFGTALEKRSQMRSELKASSSLMSRRGGVRASARGVEQYRLRGGRERS